MYWGHCAEWISQTEKGICGNLYILSSPYIRGRFVLGAGRYTRIHGYSNLIIGTLNPWVLHPWIQPDLDENFNPYLVESEDAKHVNMEGWLYIYWKKISLCKWTSAAVKSCVVHGPAVYKQMSKQNQAHGWRPDWWLPELDAGGWEKAVNCFCFLV